MGDRRGVPTAKTSERVARTLLALYCAGDRGILVSDLLEALGTSKSSLYRVRDVLTAAGWRISSERETSPDGDAAVARWTIDAWQKLPKRPGRVRLHNGWRAKTKRKSP